MAANFYQTNGVRKFFFRSNETSTHIETIYDLGKIFNRRKICYEFSKLGEKSSFFGCKVRNFEFSKKNFCMHVVTLETYKMYSNNVWLRSTIWSAGHIIDFGIFRGLKRDQTPYLPPGGTQSKFFCHNLGLGWTFKIRLLLPGSNFDLLPLIIRL